jgi:hypothetical protein
MTADLLARQTIEDQLLRYCRALDWLDEPLLAQVFWPDADIDYGFFKGTGAAFVPLVIGLERTMLRRFHHLGNILIKVDGATADAESYGITHAVMAAEGGGFTHATYLGRYLDRFTQRDGAWRISARSYLLHAADSKTLPQEGAELAGLMLSSDLSPAHPMYVRL